MVSAVHLNKFDAVCVIAAFKRFFIDPLSQYSCCVDSLDRDSLLFSFYCYFPRMFDHKEIVHIEVISLEHSSYYHGQSRTAQPDALCHRRLRMTGTEPHASRGSAGSGTQPRPQALPCSMRATPELHGAVRRGTAGRGPNRDHLPRTGRGGYASTHAHLGTTGRGPLWEPRAASGPEELRDSEWPLACPRDAVTVCFRSCTAGHGW
jgi:hypothetical protein